MGEIVARAIEMASPLLEQRRHNLTVSIPSSGLAVLGDPDRLGQVVTNVLTNAAKYTPPGGRIAITGVRAPGSAEVVLTVADDGPGIGPDLLPHVFDPFVQGERAIDRKDGGLGLGLPIVKSLVELHGGRTAIASTPPMGTQVTIALPALPGGPSSDGVHGAQTGRPAGPGTRVLVVDDNEDAAMLLAELLEAAGYDVAVAYDGPSALARAALGPPSLAILDIGLPVMDGYELATRLRQLPGLAALPMIALTGYGADGDRARSAAVGFSHHIVKPADAGLLLDLIERLDRGRTRAAASA
jgi:CheY-like chemotaxis protein